jgi:hypothetical protein
LKMAESPCALIVTIPILPPWRQETAAEADGVKLAAASAAAAAAATAKYVALSLGREAPAHAPAGRLCFSASETHEVLRDGLSFLQGRLVCSPGRWICVGCSRG